MMLTAEKLRSLLLYDPETGVFTWRATKARRIKNGDRAGTICRKTPNLRYVVISISGRNFRAHRLAWLYHYGVEPSGIIDHANGDGADNRIANLRLATGHLNAANTRLRRTSRSGIKGVSWHAAKRSWLARVQVNGVTHHLGYFLDREAAGEAYKRAAKHHFGDFARPERAEVRP